MSSTDLSAQSGSTPAFISIMTATIMTNITKATFAKVFATPNANFIRNSTIKTAPIIRISVVMSIHNSIIISFIFFAIEALKYS
jgi:hypothetical protein